MRRASGGGAILHDRELTYGIALPLLRLYPRVTRDSLPRAIDNYVSHLVYAAAYERIR